MTFSQYAGTAILPTLSRLVLCLAFVSTGWNKVFTDAEFNAAQATRLRELGVTVTPVSSTAMRPSFSPAGPDAGRFGGAWDVRPASYRQETPGNPASQPATGTTPPATTPSNHEAAGGAGNAAPKAKPGVAANTPLPEGKYLATGMHNVTLMIDHAGWPYPVWMARLAAFTELFGGALLLVGLFSRVWGLGLAIAMGVAFYLVTMQHNDVLHTMPWAFARNHENFNTMYCQLGLLLLALGVFLTGPGPLSLDRMLFTKDEPLPADPKPADQGKN